MKHPANSMKILQVFLMMMAFLPALSQTATDSSRNKTHLMGLGMALHYPNHDYMHTDGSGFAQFLYLNRINYSVDLVYQRISGKRMHMALQTGIIEAGFNKVYNEYYSNERISKMTRYNAEYWHVLLSINYSFIKKPGLQYFIGMGDDSGFLLHSYSKSIIVWIDEQKDKQKNYDSFIGFNTYTNAPLIRIGFIKQLSDHLYASIAVENRCFLLQPSEFIKSNFKIGISLNGKLYFKI